MRYFEVTIANNLDGGRSARTTTIPASAVHVAVTRALKGQKPGLNGGITIHVKEVDHMPDGSRPGKYRGPEPRRMSDDEIAYRRVWNSTPARCPVAGCTIQGDHDHNLLADVFSVPAVAR